MVVMAIDRPRADTLGRTRAATRCRRLVSGRAVEPQHNKNTSRAAIVVMGVSGSGKSTLGAKLARRLGCPFLEGDAFHTDANVAKMRAGEPLGDAERWPWLDRLGAAIAAAVARDGQAVVACSALKRAYRDRLAEAAGVPLSFVMLDADREELDRRVRRRANHYMPASLLDSQLAVLERPGADEGALMLNARWPLGRLTDRAQHWAQGTPAAQA
jgi:gluconokinase